ncbi:MAG: sulfonate ABC transporter substrate-binding protein [Geminicoccaceae bacterium]
MRRRDLMWLASLAAPGLYLSLPALAAERELRIGIQKYGSLVLLKERGLLEQRLGPRGWTVTWTEFPGGPQLLEALNVGAIDFGTTGEAPPIFAQAAGAPLLYVGYEPPAPAGEAILVPKGSPIADVAGLKGRKVALNKGSNVHYLLVKALAAAGVAYAEIEPVYLPPADARAAFERGAVDAWAIWDPFLAAAQAATEARTLVDGTGLVKNHQFYLASQSFAAREPEILHGVLADLIETDHWGKDNAAEVAGLLAPRMGIPAPILETALARMGYGVQPVDEAVTAEQQKIADTFTELGLLPRPITVRDAVWKASA